jgi:DNA-binding MarR family transcriptional regulator
MPKLTDTQLVILNAAAGRKDHSVLPLPKSLKVNKGAAVTKTFEALCRRGLLEEMPAARNAPAWREGKDGRPMTLVLTEAGLEAIEGDTAKESGEPTAPLKAQTKKRQAKRKTATRKPKGGKPAPATRKGTKQALLVELLGRKAGATVEEIVEATGWQPHSVRGAISGAVKKKLGLGVVSEKVEGRGRVYRIAERG